MSGTTSDKVRELYERYPYPPREAGVSTDPYVDYVLSFSSVSREGSASFLDAGCGTGSSVLGAALLHREMQVFGCDFNAESLKIVRQDAEEAGLSNLTLRQVDLLQFPEDFGPEEGFDVIFCTGVIHHTPNPLGILKSLASRLAPQGVLRLMVYAEQGRSDLYRFSKTVKDLTSHQDSLEEKLILAKGLMNELHRASELQGYPPPSLRGLFRNSHRLSVEEFADRYVHPHDVPYTLSTLRQHIEEAGLRFFRWFEHRSWDLNELLPTQAASGDLPEDPWERFALVEKLFDRDQYDLYLVGPDFQARHETFHWDLPVRLNPQAKFTETTARGMAELETLKIQLLFEPHEALSAQQGLLARTLSRKTASLRELLQGWGFEEDEDWFHQASYLFERDYLYAP